MFRWLSRSPSIRVCVCLCTWCRQVFVRAIQTSSSLRICSTKNVLCCQIATALKELNGDNSVVIKFPVYFPRSHLQVFLRHVALRQMPTIMPSLLLLLLFSSRFYSMFPIINNAVLRIGLNKFSSLFVVAAIRCCAEAECDYCVLCYRGDTDFSKRIK